MERTKTGIVKALIVSSQSKHPTAESNNTVNEGSIFNIDSRKYSFSAPHRLPRASIKKAKEDLKAIPARIDEVFRGKPEAQDFDALEKELSLKNKSLEQVDKEIADVNTAYNSKLDAQRGDKLKANNIKSEIEKEIKRRETN